MKKKQHKILIGQTLRNDLPLNVDGKFVSIGGESFYRIANYNAIPPFFMSLVSSSNHWLFISSTGGLTAGRNNIEQALFPYYTEDKLTENSENTGSKTILLVQRDEQTWLWEPFSIRQHGQYEIERNLYKNIPGTTLIFEEINHSLRLTYRYAWRTSNRFGFVKTSWLINMGTNYLVNLLDGVQNILPANTPSNVQNTLSCLLDAYKRNELDPETGLAIYTLNSTLTDLAEPSESLRATAVFQVGLNSEATLLSSAQLDPFRAGQAIRQENETRGVRGAFFAQALLELKPQAAATWHIVAEVHQDTADIIKTINILRKDRASLAQEIEADIELNTTLLKNIVARADGLQVTADPLCSAHHFSNVMFNVMRGGIFYDQYWVHKSDFVDFVNTHNRQLIQTHGGFLDALPEKIHISELYALANSTSSADLIRLSHTYLPLTFSRRHGDPSRPWNRFTINIKNNDGSQRLDYEGNWRDIFQNWEALAYSYPEYVESMIFKFLNATTADGYNPYRITRDGIDWETPEPGNPWANIGYWSDHQIVYLQKLMEFSQRVHPGKLQSWLDEPLFSFANVPYRIKPYSELLRDPYNTIQFDHALEEEILERVKAQGTDGKLVCGAGGQVLHRSLAEKLLILLLAKLVNFVPEGGIWMNTQRPEWNDANNALVGKGLSVVTLGYLRRYINFLCHLFDFGAPSSLSMSVEVSTLFEQMTTLLVQFESQLESSFDEEKRRMMMDAIGKAGSAYRQRIYEQGFSGNLTTLSTNELLAFFELALRYVEHSLQANRRSDHLYHAYNILHLSAGRAEISHLYEMLEGQVAILSSGMLSADESLSLLNSLRRSSLYRADQHTYILYPDKVLPSFLNKNTLPKDRLQNLQLPALLAEKQDKTLLIRDENGAYHFSGSLRNAKDIRNALENLKIHPEFANWIDKEGEMIIALFESVYKHAEFTGRSGSFFAYEGLGSVYWHMVSKLLLAVQETVLRYQNRPTTSALIEVYRDIRAGLGFNKSPEAYGAFPTDPYSHTPKGQGARQPGMTGMVKEEVLTRQSELGLVIEAGCLTFTPLLLDRSELLKGPSTYSYVDVNSIQQELELAPVSLACSLCQVPIVIQRGKQAEIRVNFADGHIQIIPGHRLDPEISRHLFLRDSMIQSLAVIF